MYFYKLSAVYAYLLHLYTNLLIINKVYFYNKQVTRLVVYMDCSIYLVRYMHGQLSLNIHQHLIVLWTFQVIISVVPILPANTTTMSGVAQTVRIE